MKSVENPEPVAAEEEDPWRWNGLRMGSLSKDFPLVLMFLGCPDIRVDIRFFVLGWL